VGSNPGICNERSATNRLRNVIPTYAVLLERSLSYISPPIFPTVRLKFVKVVWHISFANYQPAETIMGT